jgi:glutamate synthase (NADPH/NADH) small chain
MATKIDPMKRIPAREADPSERVRNFGEVALGYTAEDAMLEASRCLNCKNKPCVAGCPVGVAIPDFLQEVAQGNFARAYAIIRNTNALPAVCGRVCPQETQCEAKCVRGIKGDCVSIGRLERFCADYAMAHPDEIEAPESQAVEAVFSDDFL